MDKRDYPELEGKVIDVTSAWGSWKGVVTGCNFDIGITIQEEGNKDQYLLCFLGPSAPNHGTDALTEEHKTLFVSLIAQIKEGCVSFEKIREIVTPSLGASAETCAFSQ